MTYGVGHDRDDQPPRFGPLRVTGQFGALVFQRFEDFLRVRLIRKALDLRANVGDRSVVQRPAVDFDQPRASNAVSDLLIEFLRFAS